MMGIIQNDSTILSVIIFTPLIGVLFLMFVPATKEWLGRLVGILTSFFTFVYSLVLVLGFDPEVSGFQFEERGEVLSGYGFNYLVGVDGISLWLVVLTTFLSMLVFISAGSITKRVRAYVASLLILETGMLGTFLALDAILFYVFWELMLVPMYFLIGVWGGQNRIYAAIKFVLFTAFGSVFMLVAIIYLGYLHQQQLGSFSFYIHDWMRLHFSYKEELWLFVAFALAFAIKIPVFPLHTWLPDAHVEAPTGGSVILAGVLLKMGIYGLIRFCVPLFPNATYFFLPLLIILALIGIVYGALMAWVQDDIKKLVAYSSVSHLGFCVLGLAVSNFEGMQGALLQMVNHGISTGALFFLVGVLYDRKHTREIIDYGGLAAKVPRFALVYLLFTLSSIGLPFTNGFIGEFLIIFGAFRYNIIIGMIAVSGVVLGAVYMLSLYRRVCFGEIDNEKNGDLTDLSIREKLVFIPLLVMVLVIGLFPQPFLTPMEKSTNYYLRFLKGAVISCEKGECGHE